jgi:hypothetical protein
VDFERIYENCDFSGALQRSIKVEYDERVKSVLGERNKEIEAHLEMLYTQNRYIIDPRFLQDFIEDVEQEISLKVESFKISYANRYIHEDELPIDVLGRPVNRYCVPLGSHILLLLDPFPGGNWSHPCLIGFWHPSMKQMEVVTNDFPPSQHDFTMVFSSYLPVDHLLAYAS